MYIVKISIQIRLIILPLIFTLSSVFMEVSWRWISPTSSSVIWTDVWYSRSAISTGFTIPSPQILQEAGTFLCEGQTRIYQLLME